MTSSARKFLLKTESKAFAFQCHSQSAYHEHDVLSTCDLTRKMHSALISPMLPGKSARVFRVELLATYCYMNDYYYMYTCLEHMDPERS